MRKSIVLILIVSLCFSLALLAQDSTNTTEPKPEPLPTVVPHGIVDDFEGDTIPFHHGWIPVTDTLIGGKSTVTLSIVPDGADGSKQSLQLTGSVQSDNPYVMFAGGASRFGKAVVLPYDVTGFTGIRFWAKGDGNTYRIELPTAAITDFMYYSYPFTPPTGEWREYSIPFKGFKQQPYGKKVPWTGTDVIGVHFFTVGGPIESFNLHVDQIEFYK